jgi:hypothetical protein
MQRAVVQARGRVSVVTKAMATQRKSSAKKASAPAGAGGAGRTLWLPNTVRARTLLAAAAAARARWARRGARSVAASPGAPP